MGSLHVLDLTELTGVVHFKDLQEGITLAEQVDEVTGMSQLVVTDSPDEKRQPMLQIKGPGGTRKYLTAESRASDGAR